MYWLSENISKLFADIDRGVERDKLGKEEEGKNHGTPAPDEFDLIIIGSGYGGSILAARVSEAVRKSGKTARIALLEKGREYLPGEFPTDLGDIPKHVRIDSEVTSSQTGDSDALINVMSGESVTVVIGQALGGTSQLNANVAHRAPSEALQGWAGNLSTHYDEAEKMLVPSSAIAWAEGSSPVNFDKDAAFERVFSATARPKLAVHLTDELNASPSNGVKAYACTQCGNCITGCNYGSKNTLTQTYLPEAFKNGVEIYTGASVSRLYKRDLPGYPTPEDLWIVEVYPTTWESSATEHQRRRLKAKRVVLAAGTIGSTEILLRSRTDSPDYGKKDDYAGLKLSPMLGRRVSGNGDGISFSYWEDKKVKANGAYGSGLPDNQPMGSRIPSPQPPANSSGIGAGPTITRMATFSPKDEKRSILIQNASMPGAIVEVAAELLCTSSMTGDLAVKQSQAEKRGVKTDPIACYPQAIENTQVLLTMGDDGSPYTIRQDRPEGLNKKGLQKSRDKTEAFTRAFIQRDGQKSSYHESVDSALRAVIEGQNDGRYVSNPVLSPIDAKLAKLLSGAKPGGGVVTVHPLGGCAMAANPTAGVVNEEFRVFQCDIEPNFEPLNGDIYKTLYVCDGSVFPRALGVNPFLTIAALAEKLSGALAIEVIDSVGFSKPMPNRSLKERVFVPVYKSPDQPTQIQFNERLRASLSESGIFDARDKSALDLGVIKQLEPLFYPKELGFLEGVQRVLKRDYVLSEEAFPSGKSKIDEVYPVESKDFSRLSIPPQLVMDVSWKLGDVGKFLTGAKILEVKADSPPDSLVTDSVRASLRLEFDHSRIHPHSEEVWPDSLPEAIDYVLHATSGSMTMFEIKPRARILRMIRGLWHWFWLRGLQEIIYEGKKWLSTFFLRKLGNKFATGVIGGEKWRDICERLVTSARYAANASNVRKFRYQFDFFSPHTEKRYHLSGEKSVTFDRHVNPWRSITEIPEAVLTEKESGATIWKGKLSFDAREVIRSMLPEASSVKHLPDTLLQLTKFGGFIARAVIQANIWHFRRPDYKPFIRRAWDFPGDMGGLVREPFDIAVPQGVEAPWPTPDVSSIRLTRYRKAGSPTDTPPKKAILMLHGLLHSAACFSTKYMVDRLDPLNPIADLSIDSEQPQNMVEYFCAHDYECWLLDMRVSTANLERKKAWTLDQVAAGDIPAAVKFVRKHLDDRFGQGKTDLNVFAHCMGAAVMSMAILQDTSNEIKDNIAKLVLCQFGPFMVPSSSNLARTQMVSVAKDFLAFDSYNPVTDEASTSERRPLKNDEDMFRSAQGATLFDRLAWTYPVDQRDLDGHKTSVWTSRDDLSICNRLSLMIGENWVHDNITETSHANLEEFIGPTRIETFWQTLYFGLKGRVVSYEGGNEYVSDSKLSDNFAFPVLFLHGQRNGLFHPRSTFLAMQRLRDYAMNHPKKPLSRAEAAKKFQYFLVEGYGHLENVIGKDANKRVFPRLKKFFES
jgi:cholesterol oxidase